MNVFIDFKKKIVSVSDPNSHKTIEIETIFETTYNLGPFGLSGSKKGVNVGI